MCILQIRIFLLAVVVGAENSHCDNGDTCAKIEEQAAPESHQSLMQKRRREGKTMPASLVDDLAETEVVSGQPSLEDVTTTLPSPAGPTQAELDAVSAECCMLSFEEFSRKLIASIGMEICDEGCFMGFIPFFACGKVGTVQNYTAHLVKKSQELCACFKPTGQCLAGGLPQACIASNTGVFNPGYHRRRVCNGAGTTTKPVSPGAGGGPATMTTTATTTATTTTIAQGTCGDVPGICDIVANDVEASRPCAGNGQIGCEVNYCCTVAPTTTTEATTSLAMSTTEEESGIDEGDDVTTTTLAQGTCGDVSGICDEDANNVEASRPCAGNGQIGCDAAYCCTVAPTTTTRTTTTLAQGTCGDVSGICDGDANNVDASRPCAGNGQIGCDAAYCCTVAPLTTAEPGGVDEGDDVTTAAPSTTLPADPALSGTCTIPAGSMDNTIITQGDAVIHAHSVYSGMCIGGTLKDGSPSQSGTVDGKAIYGAKLGGNWNFNAGAQTGDCSQIYKWSHFEWLARNLESYSSGPFTIKVFNKGGSYNMYQARPGGQGEDNGNTLMVFDTTEDVLITKTGDGRQFGPSVLAPFSTVTLSGNAGYIDGCIVAKSFGDSGVYSVGSNGGSLQMHGDCYKGPLKCSDQEVTTRPAAAAASTDSGSATTAPVSCSQLWGQCGGKNWNGATCCASGSCTVTNAWYSQCTPR